MKCWICGSTADTGEHRAKKSDLAMVFTNVSQKTPVYGRNSSGKIETMGSLKSDKFKSGARLCHHCNSTRTQPFDFAWEKLSQYLQSEMQTVEALGRIKIQDVFPNSPRISMRDVQLYFIKVLGGLLAEHSSPMSLSSFAEAILNRSAHPKVFLGFGYLEKKHSKNILLITPIEVITNEGDEEFLSLQYIVRNVFVDIVFSKKKHYMKIVKGHWHPRNRGNLIQLSGLKISL